MKRFFRSKITVVICVTVLIACVTLIWANLKGQNLSLTSNKSFSSLKIEAQAKAIIQQPLTVTVTMDSRDNKVNAVGIYLRFDPQKLQLLNMDTRSSFCQLYPEKKFDNALGTISLACGSPHPGVAGTNTIMSLQFLPLAVGNTKIMTDSRSQVNESNGQGTNILKEYPILDIPIYTGL